MRRLTPTLLILSLISFAFSLAALADSDLAREVQEAKGRAQQREKSSQVQESANLNEARKKTVIAILTKGGLKAVAVETEGYSEDDAGVLVNAKLVDGRVCQARVTDEPFNSRGAEADDSYSTIESKTNTAQKQFTAVRRLSDSAQTKRALSRIAEGAFLDDLYSGRSSELDKLVRHLDGYLLEANISRVEALINCYSANGSSKELHGVAMANKNGAILGVD